MSYIYKYMPLRSGSFFENPILRITPNNKLNDPFEALPIDKIITQFTDESLIENLKKESQKYGILSFTKSKNNHLMWAHYADEHKGITIGFDCEEKMFSPVHGSSYSRDINMEQLKKVIYSKKRDIKNISNKNIRNEYQLLEHYFFKKSDKWSYEKEERHVFSLEQSDYAILIINDQQKDSILNEIQNKNIVPFNIEPDKDKWKIHISNLSDSKKDPHHSCQKIFHSYENKHEILYFKKICESSIKSVIFGVNCPDNEIQNCLKIINNNPKLNIKKYKTKVHPTKFRIQIEEI